MNLKVARQISFSPEELRQTQENSYCVTVDCRFSLGNPEAGLKNYLDSHIPGAFYAHLDDDLSSTVTNSSGRHPLPDPDSFAAFLARSGWCPGKLLVAYDDVGGAIAARLWWLMKYFGHDCGVLLDGGIGAWREAGFALESGNAAGTELPTAKLSTDKKLGVRSFWPMHAHANVLLVRLSL